MLDDLTPQSTLPSFPEEDDITETYPELEDLT